MPCYHPIAGWLARRKNDSGKRSVVFNLNDGFKDKQVEIPCGRCIGCRLERSRQWAVRCMHEAKLYQDNCFITLTYAPEFLPPGGSLVPEHYVLFMKRLRKMYGPNIRFFHCGEYGEELGRPHHHALLFNHDFEDKWFLKGVGDSRLYTSKKLDGLWRYGHCSVGSVTFESAGYVARYALKKITGPMAEAHYNGKKPEYLTMSRRPGIGAGFYDRFARDMFPSDECVVRGVVTRPPRFYDKRLESEAPVVYRAVVRGRVAEGKEHALQFASPGHQKCVEEVIKSAAIRSISRSLESSYD